ncbi:M20 family metallopeptidase [Fusibacter sp. 3D3]|uniref:M20 family metallopeptidase n=1 Tax=Fusibacter sp. 3D3 TaxID=1048380 RepID=UPI0008529EEB|nr:M20 family metallopeptidase [Fusibacter sp. 3D3]GAU77082.1 carboxypeptidase G2 [Fusibacter sp. 3D3]
MNPVILEAMQSCKIDSASVLKTWKEIVEIESFTHNREGVSLVCDFIRSELEILGVRTKVIEFDKVGPLLIGEYGEGDLSECILLTGHMDTVFKEGFIKENPFRVEDGKAFGPGVLDMKGGVNLIFYILKLLKALHYTKPIKIIISGDEEHGHEHSNQGQLMLEESKGCKLAFNMETGLIGNSITVARKGRIACRVATKGKSAHAGANFSDGINAIHEMAYKILEIQALNNKYKDVTFSVGTIKGGTVANAVPDYAEIEIDVRYNDVDIKETLIEDLKQIAQTSKIQGTTGELFIDGGFPPFSNKLNQRAYEFVNAISVKNGLGETEAIHIGGSSDAAFITIAGVPCLCSMGVKGEWNHTNREYALVDSAIERIVLITDAILESEKVKSFLV